MKNILSKIVIFSFLVSLLSCFPEKIEMDEISDIFITWSPLKIYVNENVSLGDGSRGVTWRQWTFPANGVCKIVDSDELTSSESVVHATFLQPGTFDVRLEAKFIDPALTLDSLITVTVLPNP